MMVKISPSVMCCKLSELPAYIRAFERMEVDSLHFDVMDGHFVRNVMLGTTTYRDMKAMTKLPIDIHFMCLEPEKFFGYFRPEEGDRVSFHPQTCNHPYRLLQEIQACGCKAGLVLDPGTPINVIEEFKQVLDYVLLMTVNPGFAGQTLVPGAIDKIHRVRELLDVVLAQADLFVDGNTTFENAALMRKAGANGFVVGTSSLLSGIDTFGEKYNLYKQLLDEIA